MIRRGISKGFEGDGNRLIPDGIIRLLVEARTDVHLCGRILHFYKGNITAGKVELLYLYSIICIMIPPAIEQSTKEERRAYVLDEWKCLHNCELCGKCHVLKGQDVEVLYADYIEGLRSYMDVTIDIRNRSY